LKREQVEQLMQDLGVRDEFGPLDAPVGKAGSKLSGGQKQLVWCIRIMLRDPQIILMDEPSASMDPNAKRVLARLLTTAAALGKTIIVVTHDDFLMRLATRHIRIEQQKIVHIGFT
jgi:ABC-type bacteriocin/lantibiotic exporter with double-glycine peptidase domain